jgi:hypothetical protein
MSCGRTTIEEGRRSHAIRQLVPWLARFRQGPEYGIAKKSLSHRRRLEASQPNAALTDAEARCGRSEPPDALTKVASSSFSSLDHHLHQVFTGRVAVMPARASAKK